MEKEEKQRPRWPWVSALCVVLTLIVGAIVVYTVPVFQFSSIETEGNSHVSQAEIEARAGLEQGENLLHINTNEIATDIVSHPWVASVNVKRQLPDTVLVRVQEREAVAFIDTPEGTQLIDGEGKPFVIDEAPESAIHITGAATDDEEVLAGAIDIARALDEPSRALVASVESDGLYEHTLILHDGRRIFWGEAVDNENKAKAFSTVVGREGGQWDISNPSMPAQR